MKIFAEPLSIDEQIDLVRTKVNLISSVCQPTKIILFGSAARLAMTEQSDVDFVIVVPDNVDIDATYKKIASVRSRENAWPEDILVVSQKAFDEKSKIGGVYFVAAEDGVEVYPNFGLKNPKGKNNDAS